MKIYVKLYPLLRKHHPAPNGSLPLEVDLPAGAAVADLLPVRHLPAKIVRSAFVNNAPTPLQPTLKHGVSIGLFPPVFGG